MGPSTIKCVGVGLIIAEFGGADRLSGVFYHTPNATEFDFLCIFVAKFGRMKLIARIIVFVVVLLGCNVSEAARKAASDFVIVIDAGHGGHDAGAIGAVTNEKTINLAVARLLGKKLSSQKGVKVVYTRTDDSFVTLQGRADIANKAGGNLFVSIHTNSVDLKAKNRASVHGASVYTLGPDKTEANLAVAMRENSVMKLERDYTSTYMGFDPSSAESYIIFELSQNKYMQQSLLAAKSVCGQLAFVAGRKNNGVKQANFWVLLKTAMPSMLVELDFICNPAVEKFMASDSGQEKLAEALLRGIMEYRNGLGSAGEVSARSVSPASNRVSPDRHGKNDSKVVYRIQFATSNRKLSDGSPEFKGLSDVGCYCEKGIYKYTYGSFSSVRGAAYELKKVRELFPDAFLIKTVGDKRVP